MNEKVSCLIITGPTAVGKTAVSLAVARAWNGEIINGDVYQMYQPLTIGTAKPDWRATGIPHHLFDVLDEPRSMTVVEYRALVSVLIKDIIARGKRPIIVGGSGFYLRSLYFPVLEKQEITPIEAPEYHHLSDQELWHKLQNIDPLRAQQLHCNDRYRIARALTVHAQTGQLPSTLRPVFDPVAESMHLVVLSKEKSVLDSAIDERAREMLEQGLIDEVRSLSDAWKMFVEHKKIIGYPEVLSYLNGDVQSIPELARMIALHTKQYAKRQGTFLRGLARSVRSEIEGNSQFSVYDGNLTILDIQLYVESLVNEHLL